MTSYACENEWLDYIYPAARADEEEVMHYQEHHQGHQAHQKNP